MRGFKSLIHDAIAMYKNFPSTDGMGRHRLVVESGGEEIARFLLLAPVVVGQDSDDDSDDNQQSYWSGGITGNIPESEIRYIEDPDGPKGSVQPYILVNGDWTTKKGELQTSTVAHRITVDSLEFLRNIFLAHLASYMDENVPGSNLTGAEREDYKWVMTTIFHFYSNFRNFFKL